MDFYWNHVKINQLKKVQQRVFYTLGKAEVVEFNKDYTCKLEGPEEELYRWSLASN
ncbi:hypothetical protein [uncultured Pontibacter sp.]|uniref:hypothetical protein n=1 Tax=uncultured Pontibacter sp. TaxID=453356 RepID=UPI00260BAF7D|nr:hypothetical protein [uncultured Pontibacter sp.]